MITKEQNSALLKVAEMTSQNEDWKDFAQYCILREKGLRKDAFEALEKFLKVSCNWDLPERIEFTELICTSFDEIPEADYSAFPQPLSQRLIKQTLQEWCKTETKDSRPFRWYGTYFEDDYIHKALEINPRDEKARIELINRLLHEIYYSTHHLPDYYIGEPEEDVKVVEKAKQHIQYLTNKDKKAILLSEFDNELELIENYILWKKSGHPNLAIWGKENNKHVSSGTATTEFTKD